MFGCSSNLFALIVNAYLKDRTVVYQHFILARSKSRVLTNLLEQSLQSLDCQCGQSSNAAVKHWLSRLQMALGKLEHYCMFETVLLQ